MESKEQKQGRPGNEATMKYDFAKIFHTDGEFGEQLQREKKTAKIKIP